MERTLKAVAVYCGSSMGKHKAYVRAAESLGRALAAQDIPLVYGGGSKGLMGVVSGAVLKEGGKITGVIPSAMLAAGGENVQVSSSEDAAIVIDGKENTEIVIVKSMHARKVEMAKRVDGFVGLPGGFGTFEEVLEVTTWTQLGIHNKPVVVLNILSFWEPLRQLIKKSIESGYVRPENERLIVFVDGPSSHAEHEAFDWGKAALEALREWEKLPAALFDWTKSAETRSDDDGKLILS